MRRIRVAPVLSFALAASVASSSGATLPDPAKVQPVLVTQVPKYCEGVVFDHAGNAYISSDKYIYQVLPDGQTSVWAEPGGPNGHKILADGTHLVCDHSQHAVLQLAADGKLIKKAASECGGKPLRAPNDLSLDPAGGFYFTDPADSSDKNPVGSVHYVDPAGAVHLVDEGLAYPNGIVLRPGGKVLLVAESKQNRILHYDLLAPGKVGRRSVFAELPTKGEGQVDNQPDGMCLDAAGNLYVAHYGMRQVQVLNPMGKIIARYPAGNLLTSNVAFGGPNLDHLYVTGSIHPDSTAGGLFRLELQTPGLRILPEKKK